MHHLLLFGISLGLNSPKGKRDIDIRTDGYCKKTQQDTVYCSPFTEQQESLVKKRFTSKAGIKQGGCISCPLFTFYFDATIESVYKCGPDAWLNELHYVALHGQYSHLCNFQDHVATFGSSAQAKCR